MILCLFAVKLVKFTKFAFQFRPIIKSQVCVSF